MVHTFPEYPIQVKSKLLLLQHMDVSNFFLISNFFLLHSNEWTWGVRCHTPCLKKQFGQNFEIRIFTNFVRVYCVSCPKK